MILWLQVDVLFFSAEMFADRYAVSIQSQAVRLPAHQRLLLTLFFELNTFCFEGACARGRTSNSPLQGTILYPDVISCLK